MPIQMALVQASTYYGNIFGNSSSDLLETSDKANGSLSSPSSTNSAVHRSTNFRPEEAHSVITFKAGYNNVMHGNGNFLCFEQNDDHYSFWEDDQIPGYNSRQFQDFNCVQSASFYEAVEENQHKEAFEWPNCEANGTTQKLGTQEPCLNKRPHEGESMQLGTKKQCTSATKKPKPKPSSPPSKDPQSVAAKNRRERISERLKTLQELVPNGSKVDLVTMLEKAISYVKFLQLQVKVLATDEFWPVQGGKAPDISQVKEAIDAILSSQRERNPTSE